MVGSRCRHHTREREEPFQKEPKDTSHTCKGGKEAKELKICGMHQVVQQGLK